MIGSMLHIHCGDCSADLMRRSKVPGDTIVWADLLHEGPTPEDLSADAWRQTRAAYLAAMSGGSLSPAEVEQNLMRQDDELMRARLYHEVVLWFDACLYDMCHLMHHLHALGPLADSLKLSIICLDSYPGIAPFLGLGQLQPADFETLLAFRQPASATRIAYASRAWSLYRSADPLPLSRMAQESGEELPALQVALQRHLQQFPWLHDGLSRSEYALLRIVADGVTQPEPIFRAYQRTERRPFAGDTTVYGYLNNLIHAPSPALHCSGADRLPTWILDDAISRCELGITDFGHALLAGEADWIAANGIDRWRGGAHLTTARHWRWDPTGATLVMT